ncbi:UDP-N-acetylmuramate--L-alanine ligase [Desulfofustis glycolicus]|uniref:UDP-N-acetylmuramate--L-alanine ligase n=1 Tax=Desulfofustis glycolicus DSM 9705 TaxID=1121409 RepID=A0A1M5XN94_9BACT|nr:Mur ligase family protein [Desulfofustis glycolicus]SHI01024.1 UDP-N-acetylmuramate--L-alanine ligase [Desulfofustis glycolicus DSM 9705]
MTETTHLLDPALNRLPATVQSIHLMGIGGTAMAALAGMLSERGYRVSGSDNPLYPPMSDLLDRLDIEVAAGYQPENLSHRPDLVVVGNVISRDNPEARALADAGLPYLSMPQAVATLFLASRRPLVIAGTHGKTTTASLLAAALHTAGADPGFLIGGIVQDFGSNYRLGGGPVFVIEGDEYDTAFFDKGSKFLHYRPEVAVITSIEFDHADIFADLEAIKHSFHRFVSLLPQHGLLVANLDDPVVAEIAASARCPVQSYGRQVGRDWRIGVIDQKPEKTSFQLYRGDALFADMTIHQPGLHNCLNATAAVAVMSHLGLDRTALLAGCNAFKGVRRRQEIRGVVDDIIVIDDFAHHPTAVRETLIALRQAYGDRRLIAVFEPRSNSSRRSLFQQAYAASFGAAHLAIIKEPPILKETDRLDRLSAALLADEIDRNGGKAVACADTDAILTRLGEIARPGDVIAILSNGGFDDIHRRLLAVLAER